MDDAQGNGARGFDTVVFDLGNVLLDWEPRYLYRGMFDSEEEMETFLSEAAILDWHHEQDRGRTIAEGTELLTARHPEYAREIEAFYERWDEMFDGEIPGTVDILRELRERGYTVHALTNYSAETFPLARRRYEFLGWFGEIVVSGEEGMVKPDREIYDLLVERAGIEPATSVFVDDKAENIRAAEEIGFTGIIFRNAGELRERMSRLGILAESAGRTDGREL